MASTFLNSSGIRRILMLGGVLVLAGFLISCGESKTSQQKYGNADINLALQTRISGARGISDPGQIHIETEDGVVTLNGNVTNLLAKERATRLAESVRGVKSVVNNLDVQSSRSDSATVADVTRAIERDPATEDYEISASVINGTAILTGTVESWREKDLAASVVRRVKGVQDIENDINVDFKVNRPAQDIKADVLSSLKYDTRIDAGLIKVNAQGHTVTLTGTVGSAQEKDLAEQQAHVIGVDKVDASGLEVNPDMRSQMQGTENVADLSDDDMQAAIEQAFKLDPRVDAEEIGVDVDQNKAILSGTANNMKSDHAAAEDAKNTLGITQVVDNIDIVPENSRPNAEVQKQIEQDLNRDPYIDPANVEVTVNNGIVTLDGQLKTYFNKWEAGDIAARVRGVTGIKNDIKVNYKKHAYKYPYYNWDPIFYDYDYQPANKTDAQLVKDVRYKLKWSPFVDADDIQISATDGVITLSGKVRTWFEENVATNQAYEAGASQVINKMSFTGMPNI